MVMDSGDSKEAWRTGPVSAVVCNFNGEEYLPECLDALLELKPGLDEILVVDDGSSDGSLELLRDKYSSVRVLALEQNRGACAARNAGLAAAAHRAVLCVDNDVVLNPDVLGKLQDALIAEANVAVVQARSVVYEDPSTVHYDGAQIHFAGLLALRNFFTPLDQAEGQGVVEIDGMIALTMLVDREALGEVGAFDESLFYLMEDFDLGLRLRLRGYRMVVVEDAIVRHKGGTAGLSFRHGVGYPKRRAYFHSRNRWMIFAKCYHWRTLLFCGPAILGYELVWLVFSLLKGNFIPTVRGKLGFFVLLLPLLAKRREIQNTRTVRDRDLFVGGPLTLTPQLVTKTGPRVASQVLDVCLRSWWALVRPFCG
ncbi:MAG: GT2 family glycosyltransferase [Planctomycetota bacterium]|jgi:GT2 family glycosyltransferase